MPSGIPTTPRSDRTGRQRGAVRPSRNHPMIKQAGACRLAWVAGGKTNRNCKESGNDEVPPPHSPAAAPGSCVQTNSMKNDAGPSGPSVNSHDGKAANEPVPMACVPALKARLASVRNWIAGCALRDDGWPSCRYHRSGAAVSPGSSPPDPAVDHRTPVACRASGRKASIRSPHRPLAAVVWRGSAGARRRRSETGSAIVRAPNRPRSTRGHRCPCRCHCAITAVA